MNRVIFQEPITYNDKALHVEMMIQHHNGKLNDEDIAKRLSTVFGDVTDREVRQIIERLNYNKYLEINNAHQYRKIKGKYQVIDRYNKHRDKVRNKKRTDFLAELKRFKITEQKLGDVNVSQMTLSDIEKYLEVE